MTRGTGWETSKADEENSAGCLKIQRMVVAKVLSYIFPATDRICHTLLQPQTSLWLYRVSHIVPVFGGGSVYTMGKTHGNTWVMSQHTLTQSELPFRGQSQPRSRMQVGGGVIVMNVVNTIPQWP